MPVDYDIELKSKDYAIASLIMKLINIVEESVNPLSSPLWPKR